MASIDPFSGMCVPGKVPERFPGPWKVALALVEIKGLRGYGVCFRNTAGRSQGLSQIEQGIGTRAQQIRLGRKRRCRGRQFQSLGVAAAVGEDSGRQSLADDLGGQVLPCSDLLAYFDQLGDFAVTPFALRR